MDTILTEAHVDRVDALLRTYEITPADLERVRTFGRIIVPKLDGYVTRFYAWLGTQPYFEQFFSDSHMLSRVKRLQLDYWQDFFAGQVDAGYLAKRERVGEVHARIGLPLPAYFTAMNYSLKVFIEDLYDGSLASDVYAATFWSITKLLHLDTTVVVETFSRLTNRRIQEQSQALIEMSTPVTAIWEDILMLPIVGIIDSQRAHEVMNSILTKIAATRAKMMIMDISGVGVVDTAVANHLIKITKATRLMGCECIISGLSPAIAQTIVDLGVDVGDVRTTSTLRDALENSFRQLGIQLRRAASLRQGTGPAVGLSGGHQGSGE
jgi:rsbT co-antagonist protein RsbR